MKNNIFVGRAKELLLLNRLLKKKTASIAVINGRRRIGKSALAREFGKHHRFLSFSGLPPHDETTAQSQRENFSRQLSQNTALPLVTADHWSTLFHALGECISKFQKAA